MNRQSLVFLFVTSIALAQPADTFQAFKTYVKSGTLDDDGLKKLGSAYDGEKQNPAKAKMAFALGYLNFKKGDFQKSADYFGQSLNLKTRLDDYAHYYIGMIEKDKDPNGARQHFQAVRTHQPPSSKEAEAEIALADIAKTQGKWSDAFTFLAHLERKHRGDAQYSDIIYNLIEASLHTRHRVEACAASLKYYTKYAAISLTRSWGFDLSKVKVGGLSLSCGVGLKEREKRMDSLIISGEFDEVRNELKDWSTFLAADGRSHAEELGHLELEVGELALTEGKVKEAITHFQTAQQILGRNSSVQMLLSKAYAQTDDYATAVESYLKVYQMGPRSKVGLKALFQAAFLSYQYRDYDGASRRFEEVLARGRGKIVWDARWHLAWIRYLKTDYDGAKKEFIELSKNKHYAKPVDIEKLTYWRAMAEYRDGNILEARTLFTQLSQSKRLGYYMGAAQARLSVLPEAPAILKAAAPVVVPSASPSPPTTTASPAPASSPTPVASAKNAAASRKPASEEVLGGQKETEKLDETASPDEEPDGVISGGASAAPGAGVAEDAGPPSMTSLKNPSLVERFARAEDFIDLGFDAWAVTELHEIERRTTNHGYLQNLMTEYLKAGDYFRSALIADNVFQADRESGGVDGAKMLWDYAFPQAFSKYVLQDSKKFDVSPALIWSIMRGESGYREEIHSTAGALGLMQLIPPTAKRVAKSIGLNDFHNSMLQSSETNILLGTKYLKRLNKVMGNNLPLTIASYNAGPHRVQGWLKDFGDLDLDEFVEHIPYMETRNYVKKVLRNYLVYASLYGKDTNVLKFLAQKPTIKFTGPKPTSESWEEVE